MVASMQQTIAATTANFASRRLIGAWRGGRPVLYHMS
jgi:hypothetical protein